MSRSPLVGPSRRHPSRLAAELFALLGALALLTACVDEPLAPAVPPTEPPAAHAGRVLGVVEVTLTGLGTNDMHASVRPVVPGLPGGVGPGSPASGLHLALTPVLDGDGTIQLEPVSTGSFTEGVRGSGGERYLYATFRVRNAQAGGTPYADARTNLTFLAVSTAGTLDGTAISTLRRFDGSAADPAIATQTLPTGAVHQASGQRASTEPDVLQLLVESEAASFTAPAGVTSVFPYGFVVRHPNDPASRTLPANPAAGQFDGVVTFALRLPLQVSAADDPFTVSAMFLAVDDDATRVTQSLEEQDAAAATTLEARGTALGATGLTLLPGGTAFLGTGGERVVCAVRTAGPAGSPTATLALPSGSEPWLVPAPMRPGWYFLPGSAQLAVARCPAIPVADAGSFAVHGFQSGRPSGAYTGAGTSLVHAPPAPGGGFFAGEEVEVTMTTALGGSRPVVARYRVAATGGTGAFPTTRDTVAVGASPTSVAAADLDGDGDLDLATANNGEGTVSILKNDFTGTITFFDPAVSVAVGSLPSSITAADLDGDGDLDLATANNGANTVSILQNDGTGSFTLDGSAAVGAPPTSITVGDLDGDGDLDLATANGGTNSVSILRNDGTGSFTLASSPATGDSPQSLTAGDLDGDGDLDLAVVNGSSQTLSILRNDGTGSFAPAGSPAVGGSFLTSITVGDLDGDGDLDLAVAASGLTSTVSILQNDGTGAFTSAGSVEVGSPNSITVGDLDGDGDLDLAVANWAFASVSILRNDGAGGFGDPTMVDNVTINPEPWSIITADLDRDGDLDLITANNRANNVLILNNKASSRL